jgi:subtilisin family serine protease
MRRTVVAVCLALASASPAFAERVIVKCKQSCDPVAVAVNQDGGRVIHRFKYVTALVAEISDLSLPRTRALVDAGAIRKDLTVTAIDVRDARGGTLAATVDALGAEALDVTALATPGVAPAAYTVNNVLTNVQPLHASGFTGRAMKVAVLDSGIRPGYPHLSIGVNAVIGGEDFVKDGLGFSNAGNNGHGTFTAGLIAAHVIFPFAPTSVLLDAIRTECPACVVNGTEVPMIGSAPESSIYAMRVLGVNGSGQQSWIIAAMERVIDLRRAYDAGHPETQNVDGSFNALNIRVANMSLGGTTLFPGRDIEDELTNAFLDNDIVLVVAAGNNGPSGGTVASPGSGIGSLTVGAASTAMHERILRDVQLFQLGFGVRLGQSYRPFSGTQTAIFSSRGPNADGRPDPDIVANGFASFGQGLGNPPNPLAISLGSGTSASAPTVAGIAAVLRQAVPNASARQVRNALILTADPSAIADGSGPNDRGAGFVNAGAARAMLASMVAPDTGGAAGGTNRNVFTNLQRLAGIETFSGDVIRATGPLLPGQRFETFYRVRPDTSAVIVTLSDVRRGATQNTLFAGDDIVLTVHSAKMSAVPGNDPQFAGDYKVSEFTLGGRFVIERPELGILRVTVNGDSINASPISGVIRIQSIIDPESGKHTANNRIDDGDEQAVPFVVPFGAKQLSVKAEWEGDWGTYPANDIDVVLQSPDGNFNFDAATLDNPEHADVKDPAPGKWTAFVLGFEVNSKNGDKYKLTLMLDGEVIKPRQ